jgi:hypothetical protein
MLIAGRATIDRKQLAAGLIFIGYSATSTLPGFFRAFISA